MQDELGWLWKGDIIRKKIKDTVVDQEVPVPKRDIFDRKHPMLLESIKNLRRNQK